MGNTMIHLKGMTWKHERGLAPLLKAAEEFNKMHPGIRVSWDARSLEDFEDYPIEVLARKYDVIMIDHPFIGTGALSGCIIPLNEWIGNDYLQNQKANSVGKSYESYTWKGQQWALAVDAAAQTAAYRPDLMEKYQLQVPQTWQEVKTLISSLPEKVKAAIALAPNHAMCCFIAIGINLFGEAFWNDETGIDEEEGKETLDFLQSLIPLIHPECMEMNPIAVSDRMTKTNEIAYVPLMFEYINYARNDFSIRRIAFTDIPRRNGLPVGSVLGGVGLSISSYSQFKEAAVELGTYIAGEEFQATKYFESGGQPGHAAAWKDPGINRMVGDSFYNTIDTLENAFMRPRKPGYNKFQKAGAAIIHDCLKYGSNKKDAIKNFNQSYWNLVSHV